METKYSDKVKVFYSSECDSIEQLQEGGGIEVKASLGLDGNGGGTKVFRPRLLVGADGLRSTVSDTYIRLSTRDYGWVDRMRLIKTTVERIFVSGFV